MFENCHDLCINTSIIIAIFYLLIFNFFASAQKLTLWLSFSQKCAQQPRAKCTSTTAWQARRRGTTPACRSTCATAPPRPARCRPAGRCGTRPRGGPTSSITTTAPRSSPTRGWLCPRDWWVYTTLSLPSRITALAPRRVRCRLAGRWDTVSDRYFWSLDHWIFTVLR